MFNRHSNVSSNRIGRIWQIDFRKKQKLETKKT